MQEDELLYDVAIVGCGPVGALAANLLGKAGLRTLVVEKELYPHPLPRAVHIDHEMKRLFQAAGVIDAVAEDMRETDGHLHIGADLGVIRYMGTVGQERPFGWANDYFFYQPELEAHLRGALGAYSNVALRLGTSLEGLEQDNDQVRLFMESGEETWQASARWVIGCDGARSAVRRQLGVTLDDLDFDEPWLVVDAEVEGPVSFPALTGVPAQADLQRLSVMMCNPTRPATIVPGRGNHRRWEFMLLPGENDQEMMRPERVAELVGPYLQGTTHRLVRATTYHFHGLIAERWQVGRAFLAGDAAHQTPPFFGQGMCHGFRDVANLAWKMQLVREGTATSALLDTYQLERDPHVRSVISAAVEAGRYICMLDPQQAAARDATMRERARDGRPTTAADLIPAIEHGVVAEDTPSAGQRFIQPWITVGGKRILLDDWTGDGWRLFVSDAEEAQSAQASLSAGLANIPVKVIDVSNVADGGALAGWLASRHAKMVLVRPDFYVFGTSNSDVESLIEPLRSALGERRAPERASAA